MHSGVGSANRREEGGEGERKRGIVSVCGWARGREEKLLLVFVAKKKQSEDEEEDEEEEERETGAILTNYF